MHKVIYPLTIVTAILGLVIFIPFGPIKSLFYSEILITHIIFGIALAVLLIRIISSHALVEISNPFKLGFKKWNGFKLLLYLFFAIISGLIIVVFHLPWLIYFHGFIGLWALLVGWKHKRPASNV